MSLESGSNKTISIVVGLVVALMVIAFLLPVGIASFYNANWTHIGQVWNGTTWLGTPTIDASLASMIATIIPIMIVLGIVLSIIGMAVMKRK